MRRAFNIALDAYWRFLADDGWAIASHIALSALMAMFPFFILLTSLAGVFGSSELPDEVAKLMLATWPEEAALPIALEIHHVLTTTPPGAAVVVAVALCVAHQWLRAGRRRLIPILPGIVATLALWLVAGIAFGRYLAEFATTYVSYYAGLASAMTALVFLYWTASSFVYGGALNAAVLRPRSAANAAIADICAHPAPSHH